MSSSGRNGGSSACRGANTEGTNGAGLLRRVTSGLVVTRLPLESSTNRRLPHEICEEPDSAGEPQWQIKAFISCAGKQNSIQSIIPNWRIANLNDNRNINRDDTDYCSIHRNKSPPTQECIATYKFVVNGIAIKIGIHLINKLRVSR